LVLRLYYHLCCLASPCLSPAVIQT